MSGVPNERELSASEPENVFIELFAQTFGLEKVQLLRHDLSVDDIYGHERFIDYALKTPHEKVAFEIDGLTWHLPQSMPVQDYEDSVRSSIRCLLGPPRNARVGRPLFRCRRATARRAPACGSCVNRFKRASWGAQFGSAPSAELVQQAVETAKALWTQFPNGPQVRAVVNSLDVQPDRNSITNAMAFVTAQLAAKRLDGVRKFAADCMIFDEAHQAVARTFAAVVRGQLAVPNSRAIGLSATPGRSLPDEEESLSDLFADTLITAPELGNDPVAALRSRGVLAKLEVNRIELPPQWDRVRVSSAKGPALSIDDLALHPARFWATVGAIEGLKAGAKALVFCASLAHCYALAGALESRQVSTAVISHKTPSTRRASLLARFAAGEIPVLLNKTILATGYDCPTLSDVVLATPIRSAILWEQILGRASRGPAVGGKKVGRIWELDDHRKLHGRVLSYARYLGEIWT